MSKIEVGRWSELLRRALGMAGTEMVAAELSPEVSPTWQIESDSADWQFLKAVRLMGSSLSRSAVAAEFNRFHLVNPLTSGMLAVVEQIDYSSVDLTGDVLIRIDNTALATLAAVGTSVPRDNRWEFPAPSSGSPLVFSVGNAAAGLSDGFLLHIGQVLASVNFRWENHIVLVPGTSIQFGSGIVNTGTRGSVQWRERRLPFLEQ